MELHIYEKKTAIKTYYEDAYDLKFGTIEDVAKAVKLDDIKTGSNDELMKLAINLVLSSIDTVKDLMKDIFDGITDAELRCCSVSEMALVLVEVINYTMRQLTLSSRGN